jgi:hypothetical protein
MVQQDSEILYLGLIEALEKRRLGILSKQEWKHWDSFLSKFDVYITYQGMFIVDGNGNYESLHNKIQGLWTRILVFILFHYLNYLLLSKYIGLFDVTAFESILSAFLIWIGYSSLGAILYSIPYFLIMQNNTSVRARTWIVIIAILSTALVPLLLDATGYYWHLIVCGLFIVMLIRRTRRVRMFFGIIKEHLGVDAETLL